MNGDDANTGDDNAKESDRRQQRRQQRQQGRRQPQQGRQQRSESIWFERDLTRLDATTATTMTTPASGLFTMVTILCPIHSYRQSCWFRSRFISKVYCVLIHDSLHRLTVSGVCNSFAVLVQVE